MAEPDDMKKNWRGKTREEEKAIYAVEGDRFDMEIYNAIVVQIHDKKDTLSTNDLIDYTLLPPNVVNWHIRWLWKNKLIFSVPSDGPLVLTGKGDEYALERKRRKRQELERKTRRREAMVRWREMEELKRQRRKVEEIERQKMKGEQRNWRGKTLEEEKAHYDPLHFPRDPEGIRTEVTHEKEISSVIIKLLKHYPLSDNELVEDTLLPLRVVNYHTRSLHKNDVIEERHSSPDYMSLPESVWELTHKGRMVLMNMGLGYWGEKESAARAQRLYEPP